MLLRPLKICKKARSSLKLISSAESIWARVIARHRPLPFAGAGSRGGVEGSRLCAIGIDDGGGIVLGAPVDSAVELLGPVDAIKLRSSMTLFHRAAADDPLFASVLDRYFAGTPDEDTDRRLRLDG